MKPAKDRHQWLLARVAAEPSGVDVLNSDFVTDYAEANDADASPQFFGAPKCPRLGQDLAQLHKRGLLSRRAVGIGDGLSGQGFPKWVYNYRIARSS